MSIIDRFMGREDDPRQEQPLPRRNTIGRQPAGQMTDEQALERYRYMLQTAPPETIEQAHEEAFAKLTPQQRRMVLEQLSATAPPQERIAAAQDDPQTLARMATRAELRQPGMMERTFGGVGGGMGMGGMMAGNFLTSIAGAFVGSMIAQQFFNNSGFDQGYGEGGFGEEAGAGQDVGNEMEADMGSEVDGGIGDIGGDLFGGDF